MLLYFSCLLVAMVHTVNVRLRFQHCPLLIGAYAYYSLKMNITNATHDIVMHDFRLNGEWHVYGTTAQRDVTVLDCCPDKVIACKVTSCCIILVLGLLPCGIYIASEKTVSVLYDEHRPAVCDAQRSYYDWVLFAAGRR